MMAQQSVRLTWDSGRLSDVSGTWMGICSWVSCMEVLGELCLILLVKL
jgi:hypothetical protein